jgi:carboxyl-terminal processing protease
MKMQEVVAHIHRDYVDTVNLTRLTDEAITKVLDNLDPHSVYIPLKEVELANTQLEGAFDGIGIEFLIVRDTIEVVTPLSGGPSEAIGLRAGDKIVKVDDKAVAGVGITNREVFGKLRGPSNTKVKVTIKRRSESKPLDFTITRGKIPTHSMDVAYMVDATTGYIKINRFAANTYDEFAGGLRKLKAAGAKRLVLDLRGNPGGYMNHATHMADDFLSEGRMIVYTKGKDALRYNQTITSTSGGEFESGAVIVLIDEGSASASEIVSGAVQDNDRGLVIGRRSFGKGLVQMPFKLSDGSELRLTISRYYTPAGRSIQKSYAKGAKDYEQDFEKRFKGGELFSADSIKFVDSLKYKTLAGRTVYGGGGIMPDVFVPLDTNNAYRYMNELNNKFVIREFALLYAEEKKAELTAMGRDKFIKSFVVTPEMMTTIIANGEKQGVKYNDAAYKKVGSNLRNLVKAFIGRSIWKEEGFYPVINNEDEVFTTAMKYFKKAAEVEVMGKKVKVAQAR